MTIPFERRVSRISRWGGESKSVYVVPLDDDLNLHPLADLGLADLAVPLLGWGKGSVGKEFLRVEFAGLVEFLDDELPDALLDAFGGPFQGQCPKRARQARYVNGSRPKHEDNGLETSPVGGTQPPAQRTGVIGQQRLDALPQEVIGKPLEPHSTPTP